MKKQKHQGGGRVRGPELEKGPPNPAGAAWADGAELL